MARIEAIGLIETASIACGVEVADAMMKAAPVTLLDAWMVTPGRYEILVHGDPSSVDSSLEAGRRLAASDLVDALNIPFVHPQVVPAIRGEGAVAALQALGLIETATVASGIVAADAAAKAAAVDLVGLHLARGIGGKSLLTFTGDLHAVEAGLEAGSQRARDADHLVSTRIIPNPHPDLRAHLQRHAAPRAPET